MSGSRSDPHSQKTWVPCAPFRHDLIVMNGVRSVGTDDPSPATNTHKLCARARLESCRKHPEALCQGTTSKPALSGVEGCRKRPTIDAGSSPRGTIFHFAEAVNIDRSVLSCWNCAQIKARREVHRLPHLNQETIQGSGTRLEHSTQRQLYR
jgi:hypothetical protein